MLKILKKFKSVDFPFKGVLGVYAKCRKNGGLPPSFLYWFSWECYNFDRRICTCTIYLCVFLGIEEKLILKFGEL